MSRCPVDHESLSAKASPSAKCPVDHSGNELNHLNNIPHSLDADQPSLSAHRTQSSIPNASDSTSNWIYPSPRQFHNALRRKGWETPLDEVPVMVDIHNTLNETAWLDVVKWETMHNDECATPKLLKLQGRPNDLSPKARFHMWWHGTPRPFDRHDWIVDRCGKPVRYIIDYYSGPNEDNGATPVFYMDVRPALDSPQSAIDRMRVQWNEWMSQWNGELQPDTSL